MVSNNMFSIMHIIRVFKAFVKRSKMKSQLKILLAFILNFIFSIFEFIGGVFTGSVAIMSDALHDLGDALGIGISFFLEKKSLGHPNKNYTYGYRRYSLLGGVITTVILLVGSIVVVYKAVMRIIYPTPINYDGMIIFAIVGVLVNGLAGLFTKDGHSLNQKAVSLHMLEDLLGWIIVLIGAIVMRFTDFAIIDAIMSILVAIFIFYNAIRTLIEITCIFLEKTPKNVDVNEVKEHILHIDGVIDVHHIHVWSLDGEINFATMHVVANKYDKPLKHLIKEELKEHGISHATLEFESYGEECDSKDCTIEGSHAHAPCHRHHH